MTQEQLKELLEYREGKFYWKVKRQPNIKAGDEAGYLAKAKSGSRYKITILRKEYLRSRLVFLYFHGYLPDYIDHKDRNKLNDKIENLRPTTWSQNMCNRESFKNTKSKYRGVCLILNKYWEASIQLNKKKMYLGRFKSENEAAIAYNIAAIKYHGDFACLNILVDCI